MPRRPKPSSSTTDTALILQLFSALKSAVVSLAPYPEHRHTAETGAAVLRRTTRREKEIRAGIGVEDDEDDEGDEGDGSLH